jgi:CHAT domain-containing protein
MKKKFLIKMAVCILGCAAVGYEHIYELNQMTAMRIKIPQIQQEITLVNEEIDRLNYEFQIMENPEKLLHLAKHAEFSDLHFPLKEEILVLSQENAIKEPTLLAKQEKSFKIQPFKLSVILGAH